MKTVYKYNPEDYREMGMEEDLLNFYVHVNKYKAEQTSDAWDDLVMASRQLSFSIKHREVEGFLSPQKAEEIRNYMEDILDD